MWFKYEVKPQIKCLQNLGKGTVNFKMQRELFTTNCYKTS